MLALTRQPVSLSPLVAAASRQGLEEVAVLLPWEPMAVLHLGPGGTEAPLDMISTEASLAEVEGEVEVMEVEVMAVEVEEEATEMILDTDAVEAVEDMAVAATTGRVEAGVTVEVEEWRRSSQTTRSSSRDFPLTPQPRTLPSSLVPSESSRMTGKPATRESLSTKITTLDCLKEKPP